MPILLKSHNHPSSSRLNANQRRHSRFSTTHGSGISGTRPPLRRDDSIASSRTNHSTNTAIHRIHKISRTTAPTLPIKLPWKERIKPANIFKEIKELYKTKHLKYLTPLIFVMIYMCVGAGVFLWLESNNSNFKQMKNFQEYTTERIYFLGRLDTIFQDRQIRDVTVRRKQINDALEIFHRNLNISHDLDPIWTWSSAMYFAGTLFTTIGYGDIACETTWGRIITVIYAFLGIPLMLLTLSDLGKFLYVSINETLDWLRDKMYFLHRTKKKKSQITMLDVMSQHDLPIILEEGLANQDLASNNELPLRMSVSSQGEEDKYDSGYNKHNEKVEIFIESPSHASNTLKPTLNNSYSVDTAITIDEAVPEKIGEDEMFECEDDLDFDKPPPRMHVLVALFCTFGWIFFCAAIFILFEEWTYGESLYFFIISFLTIGLGDLSVKRRDMMNLCFIFVIIGLSLVSMCISVIQGAIEDLYKRLIMKLLLDYTAKMAQGGDYKNASMGLMQAWGSNKAAKYLMPLISAEKRKTVMATIQEEARESGIEMPAILNDIDEKSGMPKIFTIQNEEPEICEMLFENLCRENDPQRTETMSRSMMIPILSFEVHCQTDPKDLSDTDMQTEAKDLSDSDVQTDTTDVSETEVQTDTTDISETEVQTNILVLEESTMQTDEEIKDLADEFTQYDSVETFDEDIQTDRQELFDNETMTTIIEYEENGLQTESVSLSEKEIQTLTPTLHVNEVQTEPTPTEENGVQTLDRETNDLEMQTEPPDMTKFLKKICKPRRKIKRRKTFSFLQRKASLPLITPEEPTIIEATPSESTESDEDVKDESSAEKLNWDPIDGMHAEKQRPVKDLLKMFNKSAKNTANQSLSRRKSK